MDLNSAWIFVRVVQAGSLSAAARQLKMPVSTVSTKVSQLEERLGVSLLKRTTRKLHMTDAGSRYFDHAVRACSEIQEAEASTSSDQTEVRGKIRVTAPVDMGSTSLSDALAEFLLRYPDTQIELLLTDQMVDMLVEQIDLAVRVGELADSSLVAKKIGRTEFQAYASPTYLKQMGEPKKPRDLEQHDCLGFNNPVEGHWELTHELAHKDKTILIPVRGRFAANNMGSLHRLAKQGRGIALLPSFLCAEDVEKGRLRHVLNGWTAERHPVHLVHAAQRHIPRRVRALIDFLSENLRAVF